MQRKTYHICALIPYFLERDGVWFETHQDELMRSRTSQPFFQDHISTITEGQELVLSQFLRSLDELQYEKVFQISSPGEFAHRGGTVDVFPLFSDALRIEWIGNTIESITPLPLEKTSEKDAHALLRKKMSAQQTYSDMHGIRPGEYVVHLDHGVARFAGTHEHATDHSSYYILEYAHGDTLLVPAGLERKLSRYVGFQDPVISRLGTASWQQTKHRVKKEAEQVARELLDLYAEREVQTRSPYDPPGEIDEALVSSFPYEETPDQAKAIEEIFSDLASSKPMDRIVCGDVGFGKTEIALRALVRAVTSGYQGALLCPTTLLAQQHFESFRERLGTLPVRVALVTRMHTARTQKQILNDISNGTVDIAIGTHRLLSRDVQFKNLGMVVIDDEHKFGVKQKEKLRKARAHIDTLSLSATPIPRTLYFALSALKSVSFIQTPPRGRVASRIHVLPFQKKDIERAIREELARNGQIYFLHNRIESIARVKSFLERLVPNSSVRVVHGRMSERKLLETMKAFRNHEFDILLATTIIESGLDIPSVNTMIVDGAEKLGLAQAYQIKGRIGRSSREAAAYFFFHRPIGHKAKLRLQALREAESLGSGYKIAIRDMEIRGAGNILGKEQSGSINKVGLNLYCQLLSEAIEKLRMKRESSHT